MFRIGAGCLRSGKKSRLSLNGTQLEELKYACLHHSEEITEGSITVQTCWDSDCLDLWWVGIQPIEQFLCTEFGKELGLQEWSRQPSIEEHVPICSSEWLKLLEAN